MVAAVTMALAQSLTSPHSHIHLLIRPFIRKIMTFHMSGTALRFEMQSHYTDTGLGEPHRWGIPSKDPKVVRNTVRREVAQG